MSTACRLKLATAVAVAVFATGSTAIAAVPPLALKLPSHRGANVISHEATAYIVSFAEAPLASYHGELDGFAQPPRSRDSNGHERLDVRAGASINYVEHLQQLQADRERGMSVLLQRPLQVQGRFQHAFNGIVVKMTPAEAARVGRMSGVRLVEPYRELALDTDAGPALIGAPRVWQFSDGTPPDQVFRSGVEADEQPTLVGGGSLGEGTVIGVVDSGINLDSPAFAAIDGTGYTHVNPLGDGSYLGLCGSGQVDDGACNSKLIGTYDFVYSQVCTPSTPGSDPCRVGGTIAEEPSGDDSNGHGSHTAGTAAGNRHVVDYKGAAITISGVAPRANIVAYDACYTRVSDGGGLCPNVSTVAAVDQAVADGIVDVINFSIGGGESPWTDATSLAFLAAADAGIFVSASAGNSGPGAATLGHVEPWVASVAASTHGRAGYRFQLSVTGPGTPDAEVTGLALAEGADGVDFASSIPADTPLLASPGINTTDDGCSAFPAATFEGAIALVRRGGCAFSDKVNNASAAGAIAVVIANNQAGELSPSVPGTTVPAFAMSQADADTLASWIATHGPGVTAQIPYEVVRVSGQADVIASFSSRGPSGYSLVKPDVAAPGVSILAPYMGAADSIAFLSGTSMAAPHNAGAAALLRDINPTWSPMEIKSALMMTATAAMTKEDTVTAADPWDMGAGRIRVDVAAHAGLLLDEGGLNFFKADPQTGGDPSTLNIPSLGQENCIGSCSFARTFENPRATASSWTLSVEGLDGTVSPGTMTVVAGGKRKVDVVIDSSAFAADDSWHFGTLVLSPAAGNDSPELRLPIAVRVPSPEIDFASTALTKTLAAGTSGTVSIDLANAGGPGLEFDTGVETEASRDVVDQLDFTSSNGYYSGYFSNYGMGIYSADDFTVDETATLDAIIADGFGTGNDALDQATNITLSIYPDNAGVPDGHPENGGVPAPVWTFSDAPNNGGMFVLGDLLYFLPSLSAQTVTLAPGKYWLTVYPETPFAEAWAWYTSALGNGTPSLGIFPADDPTWAPNDSDELSMAISQTVTCGAPWIQSVVPASGSVDGLSQQPLTVTLDATSLAAGDYVGYVCVSSNDADEPVVPVRIKLTVTP